MRAFRALPLLIVIGTSCFAVPQSLAQSWFQPWLGIEPDMTTSNCTQAVGGRCALICPATDGQKGYVEGTDVYSSYSSVCAAAIHAGILVPGRAGAVVIVISESPQSFRGSARNGVTSLDHGRRATSFTFATDDAPGFISWQTAWSHIPADFADPVTVTCPPGGETAGKVWGTDVYTVDSMICVAAVHAGVITAKGGAVTVQRAEGLRQYAATERFGIASRGAGANSDAFAVTAARASSPPAQPPPSQPPPPAPRTIALAGFAGIGSANQAGPIAARTIALIGFAGVGSAFTHTTIDPRTIPAPGWTGVGSAP